MEVKPQQLILPVHTPSKIFHSPSRPKIARKRRTTNSSSILISPVRLRQEEKEPQTLHSQYPKYHHPVKANENDLNQYQRNVPKPPQAPFTLLSSETPVPPLSPTNDSVSINSTRSSDTDKSNHSIGRIFSMLKEVEHIKEGHEPKVIKSANGRDAIPDPMEVAERFKYLMNSASMEMLSAVTAARGGEEESKSKTFENKNNDKNIDHKNIVDERKMNSHHNRKKDQEKPVVMLQDKEDLIGLPVSSAKKTLVFSDHEAKNERMSSERSGTKNDTHPHSKQNHNHSQEYNADQLLKQQIWMSKQSEMKKKIELLSVEVKALSEELKSSQEKNCVQGKALKQYNRKWQESEQENKQLRIQIEQLKQANHKLQEQSKQQSCIISTRADIENRIAALRERLHREASLRRLNAERIKSISQQSHEWDSIVQDSNQIILQIIRDAQEIQNTINSLNTQNPSLSLSTLSADMLIQEAEHLITMNQISERYVRALQEKSESNISKWRSSCSRKKSNVAIQNRSKSTRRNPLGLLSQLFK